MLKEFETYLGDKPLSERTRAAYMFGAVQYVEQKGEMITKKKLEEHKRWLIEKYSPSTVNLRIRSINCLLECQNKSNLKLTFVKVQQKPFLENVISESDYRYFSRNLYTNGEMLWYFAVRYLTTTGVRISELVQIKVEHINAGHIDLYSKGGKLRRIYIPRKLQMETKDWLSSIHRESGFIFLNHRGKPITTRGVSDRLKHFARKYGIDTSVVYPHSFRHCFAKSFLERCDDIAFLADLMGHESIETTRIYLRKSAEEQRTMVDQIVDW